MPVLTGPAMHCPFTLEIYVKSEHGILVTVMHYFYFCCLEIRLLAINIFYMESKLIYQIQIGCFLHTSSKNVNHGLIMKN